MSKRQRKRENLNFGDFESFGSIKLLPIPITKPKEAIQRECKRERAEILYQNQDTNYLS